MKTEKTKKAFKLGITAFENGKMCMPARDGELLALLNGKDMPFADFIKQDKQGCKENQAIYKAWTQGWIMASIAKE